MKKIGRHLLFWAVFVFWSIFITAWTHVFLEVNDPFSEYLWYTGKRLPLIILSTYLLIYCILPRYLIKEKSYYKFSILFILLVAVTTLVDRVIIGLTMQWSDFHFFHKVALIRNVYLLLTALGLASLIRFFRLYQRQEKAKHQLAEDNLKTELAFLKNQVNPHFLFNALNNIYSMAVQKEQPEIASGIEHLSGIMKYLTYDSSANLVPLDKEIKLIRDYIDIQYLRMADTDDFTISLNVDGDVEDQKIAPVILLPLVENAFKHGVKPEHKSLVSITIATSADRLHCKIINTAFESCGNGIDDGGIGLENVKKRLRLAYPHSHDFKIDQTEGYFCSELQLELK